MSFSRLNRDFYDAFADEFSQSREALNPGIVRALEALDPSSALDVGCGDGRLVKALPGDCRYVGLDFSARLIGRALGPGREGRGLRFVLADFSSPLPVAPRSFSSVVCFAVLHHLTDRAMLMRELARVVKPEGRIAVSSWQITHDERMRKKIVRDLGDGDYVLRWERGGHGERWVHEVTEAELGELAGQAGLQMVAVYRSDGRSGDLGMYAVMALVPAPLAHG